MNHLLPRTHHNFTTKTPPDSHHISKTTLKNSSKKHKKAPATAGAFF
jgi:hypothetical protein